MVDKAAMQELNLSYAIMVDGELAYHRQAMLNIVSQRRGMAIRAPPWISVEERLPEENAGVFFVVEWKDLHKGYFVGLYYGNGQWEADHGFFLPGSAFGRITHWMSIPKFGD